MKSTIEYTYQTGGIGSNDKNNGEIKFRPILPESPVPEFMGSFHSEEHGSVQIYGFDPGSPDGSLTITEICVSHEMTAADLKERYGIDVDQSIIHHVPVKINPILRTAIQVSELKEAARVAQEQIDNHRVESGKRFMNNVSMYAEKRNKEYVESDIHKKMEQYREELRLKLLACLFRLSQDGNSPYAIGRT